MKLWLKRTVYVGGNDVSWQKGFPCKSFLFSFSFLVHQWKGKFLFFPRGATEKSVRKSFMHYLCHVFVIWSFFITGKQSIGNKRFPRVLPLSNKRKKGASGKMVYLDNGIEKGPRFMKAKLQFIIKCNRLWDCLRMKNIAAFHRKLMPSSVNFSWNWSNFPTKMVWSAFHC